MTQVTIRKIQFVPCWSSERIRLKRRAWACSRAAYADAPTLVARALPVPATTKLPDSTRSPRILRNRFRLTAEQRLIEFQPIGNDHYRVHRNLITRV